MSVCGSLCVQHCALRPPENVGNRVSEVMHCLLYMCSLVLSRNETEGIVRDVDNAFALDTRNWTHSMAQEFDVSNCTMMDRARRLDRSPPPRYTVPINGYLFPILVFLTVVNNSLVCIVLLKRHMRNPTNAILVAMAITDMLTGLFPIPVFIYFYGTERFHEWVPYDWCLMIDFFMEYIPTIFHTASIWLTMALAIQRYIIVCHSFKARTWCTIENVRNGTIAIYIVATLSQITRFFESYPVETVRVSSLVPNTTVSACIMEFRPWFQTNMNLYFNFYYWFRVIFIHLIPCVSLVLLNALLIHAIRVAQKRRMQLLRQNKKSESRKLKESNCTTLMLVAVVGLFLLVEFPLGLLMVFLIIDKTFNVVIIESDVLTVLSLFSNFFILLSYPLNFFIYCGMSKQFRETFKRLFTGGDMPIEREYSQYTTVPTENGKSTAVTGDETAL
ncbi:FMRFamide receptor [Plakobranchus ocellatus]|uniref:FMRFamide receptor n=1 Tax=Plakobranchus ocellatus TaxID=259542 RepID=A0AAV4C5K2_9GAST|nr:FMRFamide receptor [Plakobranchus ocellatus]